MGTNGKPRNGEHSRAGVWKKDDVTGYINIQLQRTVGEHSSKF